MCCVISGFFYSTIDDVVGFFGKLYFFLYTYWLELIVCTADQSHRNPMWNKVIKWLTCFGLTQNTQQVNQTTIERYQRGVKSMSALDRHIFLQCLHNYIREPSETGKPVEVEVWARWPYVWQLLDWARVKNWQIVSESEPDSCEGELKLCRIVKVALTLVVIVLNG